jgi:hypothetical protein
MKTRSDNRVAARRKLAPLKVATITAVDDYKVLFRKGKVANASKTGFLMLIKREDVGPQNLRLSLSLDSLVGKQIYFYFPDPKIEMWGAIARTKQLGKKGYEVGVDFSADAPPEWREFLYELLPTPREIAKPLSKD